MDRKNPERLKLFTPGPVSPPSFVLDGLARQLVHHRSPDFRTVFDDLTGKVGALLETSAPVLVMASSATGAMDAVVAGLFAEGEEVLVPVMGKFSRRWVEVCEVYGIRAHVIDVEPGCAPSPEWVREEAERHEDVCGLLLTHCETSTGALSDLEGISRAVAGIERGGRDILKCADCVSSFCVDRLRMDPWGLDCVITASQKGLLSPAGLAFLSLGERASSKLERVPPRSYYLDLRRYFADTFRSQTPFTPALSTMYGAGAAIDRIIEIGLEVVLEWARRAAEAVEVTVESAGFDVMARGGSNAVVAFRLGEVDAEALASALEENCGIYLARGQGELRGEILRVSPIGKTRGEMLDFCKSFTETAGGLRAGGEDGGAAASEVYHRVERLLEGPDIWA